jgi:hypothetical protein
MFLRVKKFMDRRISRLVAQWGPSCSIPHTAPTESRCASEPTSRSYVQSPRIFSQHRKAEGARGSPWWTFP